MKRRIAAALAALSLSVAAVPATAHAQPDVSAEVSSVAADAVSGSLGVAFVAAFLGVNLSSLFLPICSMLNTTNC